MKDVSFSWNEMLFAMQKTDFHVLELFCRASHVRASMHRITSLELLRTLMLCLVQLSKWRGCKDTDDEKLLSQWEKLLNAILRVSSSTWKMFFLMKWNVICNAEDRFSCVRVFLRAKNTNDVRAKNTNAVFSATKQMKRMQGQGCWKASFSVREVAKCNFKSKAQVHEMFLSHEMKCYLQCRRQIFMC